MSAYGVGRFLTSRAPSWLRRPKSANFSGKQAAWTSTGSSLSLRCSSSDSESHSKNPTPPDPESTAPVHPHLRAPRKLRQVTGEAPVAAADAATSTVKTTRKHVAPPPSASQWSIVSFCTASEYKLDAVKNHLKTWRQVDGESVYQLADSFLTDELVENAMHYKLSRRAIAPEQPVTVEQGDMFIFGGGSVVFWNVPKSDARTVLSALKQFEVKPFPREIVEHEAEHLNYTYMNRPESPSQSAVESHPPPLATQIARLTSDGQILFDRQAKDEPQFSLVKYAFSDAIAMSVKLATYESLLQNYVTSIENSSEDMKLRGSVAMTRDQVLRKTGELFDLRHAVNLGSNMLDPPDFYWDREDLETLYRVMCAYLNITRRTKVINEKLNHCYALLEFLRDHLNNQKSVRLELWIIALITVEVVFEMLHFAEDYLRRESLFALRNERGLAASDSASQ